jgi:cytoskeletal protein CcmA (bactofilin family)
MNMFTKKENNGLGSSGQTSPATSQTHQPPVMKPSSSVRPAPSREPIGGGTIISLDLTIIGNVVSKGQVTLDGTIQGDMHCASLVVGENGEIDGGIIANEVVVHGRVTGAIRGDRVMLQKTAHVEGDIFHQEIGIEMGTLFDGTLKRTDKPTTMVQQPQVKSS